ncbi:hypothetical protein BVER_03230c [Candidatus Burkholderia verschuerenii]|uniref:Trypsin-like peptidase domain-containing protein n=1 Tax=Candidatus Burkholderia verschuerenii TaxID=242163 RepID=A0A0L0MAS5_9BURK|nr:trypsin-like peptidase domain-containing protein [Candidatus Burkholderia verschuerenii]KND59468.1 hypothetical protein BVER_03230c [Candidatus Burkholderia verschuerenii]
MSTLLLNRVAEIYSSPSGLYGSGLLLGDGYILTARHVLVSVDDPRAILKAKIYVRTVEMRNNKIQMALAEPEWPSRKELADFDAARDCDVALIRIRAELLNAGGLRLWKRPLMRLLGNGTEADGDPPSVARVSAVGFPVFRDSGVRGRDTKQLTGICQTGDYLVSNAIGIQEARLDRLQEDPRLAAALDWSGMSGSAVFSDEENAEDSIPELIGIFTISVRNWPYEFKAVRLDPMLRDPQASAILKRAVSRDKSRATQVDVSAVLGDGNATPPGAVLEPPAILNRVCLLDRSRQEADVILRYSDAKRGLSNDASGSPRPKPLVLVLPGADRPEHAPDLLIERLSNYTMCQKIAWPGDTVAAANIVWGSPADTADEAARYMRMQLWNAMQQPWDDEPLDEDQFVEQCIELWRDQTRPRLFWSSDLTQSALGRPSAAALRIRSMMAALMRAIERPADAERRILRRARLLGRAACLLDARDGGCQRVVMRETDGHERVERRIAIRVPPAALHGRGGA